MMFFKTWCLLKKLIKNNREGRIAHIHTHTLIKSEINIKPDSKASDADIICLSQPEKSLKVTKHKVKYR